MIATIQAQDTTTTPTPVQLPDLPLGQYRALVATMQAQDPDAAARIGRGLTVLMTADIRETAECGVYLVQTSEGGKLYYRATSLRCCCPDALQRQVVCKHSHAIAILTAASAAASFERAQARTARQPRRVASLARAIPYVLTAKALAALDGDPITAA
jgi:hypothetical protein